jgi:hypothetical protein
MTYYSDSSTFYLYLLPKSLKRADPANLKELASVENNGLQKLVTSNSVLPKTVINEYLR